MHKLTEEDLGPRSQDIQEPKKNIKKGFLWLGTSSIISQGLDAVSMLVVLMFLSKEELGLATIAVAFAAVTEVFCAISIAPAMVQDDKLTVGETHSLFWFSVIFGVVFFGVILVPLLFPIASFYASTTIIPLLLAGCIRNMFGSMRQVPTALLRRRLQYSVISSNDIIINIFSGCLKIALAFLGFGAWSLVMTNTLREVLALILYSISSRYLPALHFNPAECKRFVLFGLKNTGAALLESLNKNLHYFIVGKVFGVSELAVYRVAYEVATTPPVALLNVVNSSSFPIFSRFKSDRSKLTSLFLWNIGSLAFLTIIPIVFMAFCSEDIFSLINQGIWMDAVAILPFILGYAFLKSIAQTFPELYRACGAPGYVFNITALETFLTAAAFALALSCCHVLALSYMVSFQVLFCVWIAVFLPLFYAHKRLSEKFIDISFASLLRSISGPLLFFLVSASVSCVPWVFREALPFKPWLHFGIEVVILLICLAVYFKWIRKSSKDITAADAEN